MGLASSWAKQYVANGGDRLLRSRGRGGAAPAFRAGARSAPRRDFRNDARRGCRPAGSPLMTTQLAVVIVGGRIQGLVPLNSLVAERDSCALPRDGDLGAGQTMHSHGYLNTGFGIFCPQRPRASADV